MRKITKAQDESKHLLCQNCDYDWQYEGSADQYACCPDCNYKVNIHKQEIMEEKSLEDLVDVNFDGGQVVVEFRD